MRNPIAAIESLITQDPGGRNIQAFVRADQLRLAALSLHQARRVLLVGGFYIPKAGAGETDGPPGVLALGSALAALGISTAYATDRRNRPLFEALNLAPLYGWTPHLPVGLHPSHLVAIERPGRARDGHYYNMRGEPLPDEGEPFDQWFLDADRQGIATIGIGDGGNEIGMGNVFQEVADTVPHGATIASVVPAGHLIVAGCSNWGAYGLAGVLSLLSGRDLLPTATQAAAAVHDIVRAGAVDGVTLRNEPAVDGLTLEQSLGMLEQIRRLVLG